MPRQALGVDYGSYNVGGPSLPPPLWTAEPLTPALEREALSDQEVAQQPPRNGMRTCVWALVILLVVIHYKVICAFLAMVASAWPELR